MSIETLLGYLEVVDLHFYSISPVTINKQVGLDHFSHPHFKVEKKVKMLSNKPIRVLSFYRTDSSQPQHHQIMLSDDVAFKN